MTSPGPVLRYPGAKWRLASWIVSALPAHKAYVEPFLGSGAVLLSKPPSHSEVINDIDRDVFNLFCVLRDPGLAALLSEQISLTPWSREEFKVSKEEGSTPVEKAPRFLVRAWQSHGQRLGMSCGWRHDGPQIAHSSVAKQWANIPARIKETTARLLNTQVECCNALELISRYKGPDVLLYCDPPYLRSTRCSKQLYRHEFWANDEHEALLDLLVAHPGPVVLSGYTSEVYERRLKNWSRLVTQSTTEKGKKRTEVMWINRPVFVQGELWKIET